MVKGREERRETKNREIIKAVRILIIIGTEKYLSLFL
jgi:hypothetical protein